MRAVQTVCSVMAVVAATVGAATYPPDTQPSFRAMPSGVARPAYLVPYADPTFGTRITRISDQTAMNSSEEFIAHHYAKTQPWNADGSLIMLHGWPARILDGTTYRFLRTVMTTGGHHVWSNVDPNRIYGIHNSTTFAWTDVRDGTIHQVRTFSGYTHVSLGEYEGNLSNDDRYAVLQAKATGGNWVFVYDRVLDSVLARMSIGSIYPNNVTMSQSGAYVAVQWGGANGTGSQQGIDIYDRQLNYLRKVSPSGGTHYDLGYDIAGNEVIVITDHAASSRAKVSIRLDNGAKTTHLTDAQSSWYIHVSCRNIRRPGWAYFTEFADPNTQTTKPNYQIAFGLKLDGTGTIETFGHVHHSATVDYERSPFGVPNHDGSRMMFRSDWENGSGPVYSYVAEVPGSTKAAGVPLFGCQSPRSGPTVKSFALSGRSVDVRPGVPYLLETANVRQAIAVNQGSVAQVLVWW